ncbi:hypothetical protein HPYSS1_02351 [Helicobacter pylori SS1]|nr:hypothetical protein HPSS1190_01952 [Helicobacter pylori SS1_190]KAF1000071.1 hypothetical protein HPYSS1_02351 [Helicobacter pylori SS1]
MITLILSLGSGCKKLSKLLYCLILKMLLSVFKQAPFFKEGF